MPPRHDPSESGSPQASSAPAPAPGRAALPAPRRAVPLPVVAGDPGAALAPDGAGRDRREAAAGPPAATATPSGAVAAPEAESRAQERGARERGAQDEGGADTAALAEPFGAPAAADAGAEGAGPPAGTDEAPPGRPRKPVLAAAAIAGAVLLAVPLAVAAWDDDEPPAPVSAEPAAGTTLEAAPPGARPGGYASSSSSPSPSGSRQQEKGTERKKERKKAAARSGVSDAGTTPGTPSRRATGAPADRADDGKGTGSAAGTLSAAQARRLADAASNASQVLLKNKATGKCADVPGFGEGRNGGPVNQFTCRPTGDNQLWDLQVTVKDGGPEGADLFLIRNSLDGSCMDLPDYGAKPVSTPVYESPCAPTTGDNQLWYLDRRPDGTYWVRNSTSDGMCLNVSRVAAEGDPRLIVGSCGNDRWTTV